MNKIFNFATQFNLYIYFNLYTRYDIYFNEYFKFTGIARIKTSVWGITKQVHYKIKCINLNFLKKHRHSNNMANKALRFSIDSFLH